MNHSLTQSIPAGRIDIHTHLVPGVDDGCATVQESLTCVRSLRAAGFVGAFCTPHIWPVLFPENTLAHVRQWTYTLQRELNQAGLDFRLWPGGEIRLFDGVTDWLKASGVPTLGDSRCVLVDLWEDRWPDWTMGIFHWLVDQGYRPILAHPERMADQEGLEAHLEELQKLGVWFQANTRCLTGEEGPLADRHVRQWLDRGLYQFLALDVHRPDTLIGRLEGIDLLIAERGAALVEELLVHAPRRLILGPDSAGLKDKAAGT